MLKNLFMMGHLSCGATFSDIEVSLEDMFHCIEVPLKDMFHCIEVSLEDRFPCIEVPLEDRFACSPVSMRSTRYVQLCYPHDIIVTPVEWVIE